MASWHVAAAGDSALLVELSARLDPAVNEMAVALARSLERRAGTALRDVVVGYCSVTVYFDPLAVDPDRIAAEVDEAAAAIDVATAPPRPVIDVPVCYDADFGPDLATVAAFGRCSVEDAVALHAAAIYRVYLLGFVPGFPYMAEVDPRIAAPRLATPRPAVPPGSVAIAGRQTGIYPSATPGGWNIIGRAPVTLFDPARPEAFLLHAGDRVRFRRITRAEFDRAVA